MYIITVSIHFSSWLGLACIVVFLIFTVHSYVAPTLNKLIILYYIILLYFSFFALKSILMEWLSYYQHHET